MASSIKASVRGIWLKTSIRLPDVAGIRLICVAIRRSPFCNGSREFNGADSNLASSGKIGPSTRRVARFMPTALRSTRLIPNTRNKRPPSTGSAMINRIQAIDDVGSLCFSSRTQRIRHNEST